MNHHDVNIDSLEAEQRTDQSHYRSATTKFGVKYILADYIIITIYLHLYIWHYSCNVVKSQIFSYSYMSRAAISRNHLGKETIKIEKKIPS